MNFVSNYLSLLIAIPTIGAALIGIFRIREDDQVRKVGVAFALVTAALAILMAVNYDPNSNSGMQFVENYTWIPAFGTSFALGVDGISLTLIVLAAILVPVVLIAGWRESEGHRGSVRQYVVLTLITEAMMIGVFAATDVFLFYVFFEAILIPMYILIGRFGGARASYAAVKFLLYSLVGGLLMLVSLIGLWVISKEQFGAGTFDWFALQDLQIDATTQNWLFLGFFIAFAIKAPLFPFHTWLPDAAGEATPGSATLLVGVLDKIGTFGMIRYLLPLFPLAVDYFRPVIIVMCLVGIIYGALLAIGQSDIKRLIAYTSVSHFGFIALGIFAYTSQGLSGASLYMINHGFSTAALFLIAGFLISRRGSRFIEDFGGVAKVAPLMAGSFLLAGLSSLALPGMSSFVSEFLVLTGTFTRYPVPAIIATLGIVLAALYILLMIQRTMTGEPSDEVRNTVVELNTREKVAIAPVIAIILVLGFFPQVVLNIVNPTIDRVMILVGATDPLPTQGEN
jgi:NADH-quinone oxidoreductase subunit M